MLVGGIAGVRTGGRLCVQAQRWIIELLVANPARIEAHGRQLAQPSKKLLPLIFTAPVAGPVRQRFEQRALLFGCDLVEGPAQVAVTMRIEPSQAGANWRLLFLIMGILISLQARFVPPDYFPAGPSN